MKLSDFDYSLPKGLIAQNPLGIRDAARLLVLNRSKGTVEHRRFSDIADYVCAGGLLVLNNTKVVPARLIGKRVTGGKAEVLLLNRKSGPAFEALIKPSRIKSGENIIFDGGKISCQVSARNEVVFNTADVGAIYAQGSMPLPPYIKREPRESDKTDYQTVYAQECGAIASPTAGLHFTKKLINRIESQGVNTAYITLHVGYSTFRPVKSEDITKHKMESEYYKINTAALKKIKEAEARGAKIFAVGTTSCRTLEAYARNQQEEGHTDLFIYPGFNFKMVNSLITNFHLPRTTLFMLVCAFATEKLIRKAYQEAIGKEYRFYSYGDAMLII